MPLNVINTTANIELDDIIGFAIALPDYADLYCLIDPKVSFFNSSSRTLCKHHI